MTIGDYIRDPNIKKTGKGGLPPPGHMRRCQGTNRRIGGQCPEWARTTSYYCKVHGGNVRKRGRTTASMKTNLYVTRATAKLRKLLDAADAAGDFQSLDDEITVARTLAERSLRVFDEVHFGEKAEKFDASAKSSASAQVRNCLEHVASLMTKNAAIKAASSDTFNSDQVDELVNKVFRVLEDHLGGKDTRKVYEAVVQDIENIRLASKMNGSGKNITLNVS